MKLRAVARAIFAALFAASSTTCGAQSDASQNSFLPPFFNPASGLSCSFPVKNAQSERFEREIREALTKTVSLNLFEPRLDNCIDRLAQEAGIVIRIDDKALLEANVALDKPVSVRASNVPLSSLLDMILRPLDLNWLIADDLLTITTKDVADDITEVRVYPVRDLVIYGNGPHGDFNRLIESIQSTIKPDSWSVTGGPGAVEPFYKNYSLVICQTRDVHEQVGVLFTQLRRLNDRHPMRGQFDLRPSTVSADLPSSARALPAPVRVYTRTVASGLVRVHPQTTKGANRFSAECP